MIDRRMVQAGIMNITTYLRKMAIDGYVVKLKLSKLRDMISQPSAPAAISIRVSAE